MSTVDDNARPAGRIMKSYRLRPDTLARVEALRVQWGGVAPLDATAVIEEAIRRAADPQKGIVALASPARSRRIPR